MSRSKRGTASRTKLSCANCRRRHFRCGGEQPCQRCWQDDLECEYPTRPFSLKEWSPQEVGLPPLLAALKENRSNVSNVRTGGIFVSENRRVELHYEVLDPERTKSPSTVDPKQTWLSRGGVTQTEATIKKPTLNDDPTVGSVIPSCPPPPRPPPITDPTEAFFMERYCTILGPWFDMFDTRSRHWSHSVPHLSLSNQSLFRSIIASCAKQYSLVSGGEENSSIYALDQYNRGLQELTRALGDDAESTVTLPAVFASCLLIGYCEMIDAKSLDWHTHLRGTFSLCLSQGWHGRSGGVAQSCFWVYCRMDLLASIARARHTMLDPSRWLPDGASSLAPSSSSSSSHNHDGAATAAAAAQDWNLDSWCNQVVVLLAQTHNLLCDVRQQQQQQQSELLEDRWNRVSTSLDIHEGNRPVAFRPIIDLPPKHPQVVPFRQIVYVSAAACAATQMMDLARLFLILAFPDRSPAERSVRLTSQSVSRQALDLSRKIVSNSVTNRHPIAWANAVQLLSSAGTMLVGRAERAALLQVLNDIKLETGWNTLGNRQALLAWWESFWPPDATEDLEEDTTGDDDDDDDDETIRRVGRCLIRLSST
ncbi:hypothetical protein H2204_009522 [Knufia peltigerae]|uniref:Zn(2)-C6 fungal-type domain-containing protein n=1 Tax=Knufia peltigerae TaxID=1002370 RepID=A0AA38XZ64_9EURO|nr:hypothetical protein H2204_009522 [Knufia peltigerae]